MFQTGALRREELLLSAGHHAFQESYHPMPSAKTSPPPPTFAAVDWGTSSFRLWLLAGDGSVLAERRSAEGMATLTRDQYLPILRREFAGLADCTGPLPDGFPVIICGMAGAKQGWAEAGYVDVPAVPAAITSGARRVEAAGLDVRILPGLARRDRNHPDVMRGEETQLLGLMLGADGATPDRVTVVMPGTHSKWVWIEDGQVVAFDTIMTGELFALLSTQSILKHAVAGAEGGQGETASPAFLAGVAQALDRPAAVLPGLFSLRAGGLLHGIGPETSRDRLSGLLIGAELAHGLATVAATDPLVLVASGRMATLYRAAFAAAGRAVQLADADDLVRRGLTFAARVIWM